MSWRDQAACLGKPTEWWFPTNDDRYPYVKARPICHRCVVRQACLEAALSEPSDLWGMRGGLIPSERSRIRGQRRHLKVVGA